MLNVVYKLFLYLLPYLAQHDFSKYNLQKIRNKLKGTFLQSKVYQYCQVSNCLGAYC